MQELTSDTLDAVLKENKKVIVQYGATWCGICKIIRPKFSALSDEYKDILFLYVDAEKFPESRKFAKVDNLPTFAGFFSGELVKQTSGGRVEAIKEVLNEITNH